MTLILKLHYSQINRDTTVAMQPSCTYTLLRVFRELKS